MDKDTDFEIRAGTAEDVPVLLDFIRAMAEFEKLEVSATEQSLRASLFGETPAAFVLFAYVDESPVACAVYFFTFATMVGKRGLWLDDLFVKPEFRGQGIGKAFLAHLADVAIRNDCARFEWMVLDWNEQAIGFYKSVGAKIMDEWRICRIEESGLAALTEDC